MGRGRAKAIQKKIARDLKYSSGGTDLERLQAELAASGGAEHTSSSEPEDDDDEYDPFADDDEE
jgi:hypothetical protein